MALDLLEREQKKIVQGTSTDKRYFPRWEVTKYVECIEKGMASYLSFTKDLSMEGVSIITFGSPVVRNSIKVKIYLEDEVSFEAWGHVVWTKSEPTYQLSGMAFERLVQKAHTLIMDHAFEFSNDDVPISSTISARTRPARGSLLR